MEDEYISVDNLHEHLGTAAKLPSPCAFYGVRLVLLDKCKSTT